ncbi:MAG: APC family permease [Caldilineaceae bacterium]
MDTDRIRHRVFGRELKTRESAEQTISKTVGLAVFASDSLSSVAYAGGEILLMLAVLGNSGYWLAIPITVAICGLLIILTFSYRQTIFAYPGGGGAYIVSKDNFGELAAQVAGASLLIDYILTVAVSIASGVDQMASIFPILFEYKVQIGLLMILLITYVNLRGVKESGLTFAIPSYIFIIMMLFLIGAGFWQVANGTLGTVGNVLGAEHEFVPITGLAFAFLLLRAFSSGTTALTGVEAISNGITAFNEPKSKNAATTLMWDASLLMVLFLGLGLLAYLTGAQPSEQEVLISQVSRAIFGPGIMRFLILLAATVILIMAANTSFAGFPRLAALQAGDRFLPRQLAFRSSRLVFNWGIIILSAFASLLIFVFQGSVTRLIPLYAIGVFLCFTLSQAGMAKRWHRVGEEMAAGRLTPETSIPTHGSILHYDLHWRNKMIFNAIGAVITLIVMLIFLVTKFVYGAYIIVLLVPALVWLFMGIHKHYLHVASVLSTAGEKLSTKERHHVDTIVLVADIHRETMKLIDFAQSLGRPWKALHVAVDEEKVAEVKRKWKERIGDDVGKLIVLNSPYRSLIRPIRAYIERTRSEHPDGYIHVVMGQLRTGNPATQFLHQNSHFIEQLALHDIDNVVTTIVPLHLDAFGPEDNEPEKNRVTGEKTVNHA